MEKRYIWFDTGSGIVVGVLGVALAATFVFMMAVELRPNWWQFAVLILVALLACLWPAFLLDRRRRKTSVDACARRFEER